MSWLRLARGPAPSPRQDVRVDRREGDALLVVRRQGAGRRRLRSWPSGDPGEKVTLRWSFVASKPIAAWRRAQAVSRHRLLPSSAQAEPSSLVVLAIGSGAALCMPFARCPR